MGSGQALSGEHDNHRALDVSMPHQQAMGSEQALGNEQVSSRELDNHRALDVSMCAAHASACAHVHTLRALGARTVPVVSRGDRFVFAQSIPDVVSFLGLDDAPRPDLSPRQLLEDALSDATPHTPIYFILSAGAAVGDDISALAVQHGMLAAAASVLASSASELAPA